MTETNTDSAPDKSSAGSPDPDAATQNAITWNGGRPIAIYRLSARKSQLTLKLEQAIGFDFPKKTEERKAEFVGFSSSVDAQTEFLLRLPLTRNFHEIPIFRPALDSGADLWFFFGQDTTIAGRLTSAQLHILVDRTLATGQRFFTGACDLHKGRLLTVLQGAADPLAFDIGMPRNGSMRVTSIIQSYSFFAHRPDNLPDAAAEERKAEAGEKNRETHFRIFRCRRETSIPFGADAKMILEKAEADATQTGLALASSFWSSNATIGGNLLASNLIGGAPYFAHIHRLPYESKIRLRHGSLERFRYLLDCVSTLLPPATVRLDAGERDFLDAMPHIVLFTCPIPIRLREHASKKAARHPDQRRRLGVMHLRHRFDLDRLEDYFFDKSLISGSGKISPGLKDILQLVLEHFQPEGTAKSIFYGNRFQERTTGPGFGQILPKPDVSDHDRMRAVSGLMEFMRADCGLSEEEVARLIEAI